MNNNDPFKKMDLNFDPTQEAKVESKEGNDISFETRTPGEHQNLAPEQKVQPINPVEQPSIPQPDHVDRRVVESVVIEKTREQNLSEIERQIYEDILSDVAVQKAASTIIHENTTGVPTKNDLEKTIEFIVQAEKVDSEEMKKLKKKRKEKEIQAKKSKATALSWMFILILSVIFGITSIWAFGNDVLDFATNLTGDNKDSAWNSTLQFFSAFFSSFEALLFIFFITYSIRRHKHFMKPYKEWWIETEPLRIAAAYKEEVNKHNELLEKMTIYQLTWTPPMRDKLEGTITLKEKLENIMHDNSILSKTIKNHEAEVTARAKAQAQAAKGK